MKSEQVESKIKHMCYEMIINVLEEHEKMGPSFRPKPLKLSKQKLSKDV
jgi:hypothetical protein